MMFDILCLLSLLAVILNLKRLVNIFPSLIACIIRWKESLNLEASAKLSRDRDIIAFTMTVPFCLTAVRFSLYDPAFFSGMKENAGIWMTLLIFTIYCLFRLSVTKIFHFGRIKRDVMRTAIKVSNTFFIILTLVLLATGGTMAFLDIEENTIRLAMLWISVCIYAVHLLRKLQIFNSSCSVFTAFLYLCALEIIPTGTLVVSALIF